LQPGCQVCYLRGCILPFHDSTEKCSFNHLGQICKQIEPSLAMWRDRKMNFLRRSLPETRHRTVEVLAGHVKPPRSWDKRLFSGFVCWYNRNRAAAGSRTRMLFSPPCILLISALAQRKEEQAGSFVRLIKTIEPSAECAWLTRTSCKSKVARWETKHTGQSLDVEKDCHRTKTKATDSQLSPNGVGQFPLLLEVRCEVHSGSLLTGCTIREESLLENLCNDRHELGLSQAGSLLGQSWRSVKPQAEGSTEKTHVTFPNRPRRSEASTEGKPKRTLKKVTKEHKCKHVDKCAKFQKCEKSPKFMFFTAVKGHCSCNLRGPWFCKFESQAQR
jgi:hypothetical protein